MKPKNSPKKPLRNAMVLSGAGLQMGITIYLGYKLGQWLDAKFSKTYFETLSTLSAVFLAIYMLIKQVIKINND